MADRAQIPRPDVAGQALIGQSEPQLLELVEQGAGPQVRILGQPGGDVVDERLERVRAGAGADPGLAVTGQVLADRLAVAPGVAEFFKVDESSGC